MVTRILKFLPVLLFTVVVSCEKMGIQPDPDNTPPKARIQVSPSTGDSTTPFILRGCSTEDLEDPSEFLEFRWDLNGDSIWDTEFKAYCNLVHHFVIPGIYHLRMEVRDRHGLTDLAKATVESFGINNDTARFTDPRDGQSYPVVRIGGVWWMAENLNFGTMIPDTQMSRDNGIYEKYCYQNTAGLKDSTGGYYTYYHWDEVIDYDTIGVQGLCPPGWKLPDMADWDSLITPYRNRGFGYFSAGGYSRLNLTKIGIHELTKSWEPIDTCPCTAYWMYFTRSFQKDFYRRGYRPCPLVISSTDFRAITHENNTLIRFVNDSIFRNGGALPVRCIKIPD